MKKLIHLLLLSVAVTSCVSVAFDQPQPKGQDNLEAFPEDIKGNYSFVLLKDKETVEIGKDYLSSKEGKMYLSDSLILRKMGANYVVNQLQSKEGPSKGKWSIFILESKGCGMMKATTFVVNDEKKVPAIQDKFGGELVGESNAKFLIMNPDKDEFKSFLSQDDLTMSAILEKMD